MSEAEKFLAGHREVVARCDKVLAVLYAQVDLLEYTKDGAVEIGGFVFTHAEDCLAEEIEKLKGTIEALEIARSNSLRVLEGEAREESE